MTDIKIFHGVTPQIFSCLKAKSVAEHGTKYSPPDGNKGESITSGSMWEVKLGFDFVPSSGDLTYTLISKSWIVPLDQVWDGIGSTINSCRAPT